jgi:hypothetical protein
MIFFTVLDIVLLVVILFCVGDALRQLHMFEWPIRCIVFSRRRYIRFHEVI